MHHYIRWIITPYNSCDVNLFLLSISLTFSRLALACFSQASMCPMLATLKLYERNVATSVLLASGKSASLFFCTGRVHWFHFKLRFAMWSTGNESTVISPRVEFILFSAFTKCERPGKHPAFHRINKDLNWTYSAYQHVVSWWVLSKKWVRLIVNMRLFRKKLAEM